MADNININPRYDHQMLALALALPYVNLSFDQVRIEHLNEKDTFLEKHGKNNFLNDMADYVNTFTSDNYLCKYYDINSFNSKHSKNEYIYPKICHLNIRSLNLHKHELAAYLECLNSTFDIILLTECGHALKTSIEEVFQNYEFFMSPPTSNKGGAGILIHRNLYKSIEILDNNKLLTCTYYGCNNYKV